MISFICKYNETTYHSMQGMLASLALLANVIRTMVSHEENSC